MGKEYWERGARDVKWEGEMQDGDAGKGKGRGVEAVERGTRREEHEKEAGRGTGGLVGKKGRETMVGGR